MTTEITFTLLTALLAASMWIPYIVGVNTTKFEGQAESFVRPPSQANMKPWIHRAHRAHLNLLEQFLPFAVLVLIGQTLGVSTILLGWLAIAFFVLRCVHAIGMVTGTTRMPVRPIIFTTCWIIILAYGVILFLNAPSAG